MTEQPLLALTADDEEEGFFDHVRGPQDEGGDSAAGTYCRIWIAGGDDVHGRP